MLEAPESTTETHLVDGQPPASTSKRPQARNLTVINAGSTPDTVHDSLKA